jgi:hypothetical protein
VRLLSRKVIPSGNTTSFFLRKLEGKTGLIQQGGINSRERFPSKLSHGVNERAR